MNVKDLTEGEIFVDTMFSVESGAGSGNRFYLADYATMHEFLTDCASWFSDEEAPEYVYLEWNGIPDCLITRTWLCPNIFEIRDALQMLDGDSIGRFPEWCRNNGHDLTKDDPLMLVTRYQDYSHPNYNHDSDPETTEPDDNPRAEPLHLLLGTGFKSIEFFDDDYG